MTEPYQPRHSATTTVPLTARLDPEPVTRPGPDPDPADRAAWAAASPDSPDSPPPDSPAPEAPRNRGGAAPTRASSLDRMSREGLTEAAGHAFRGAGEALNGLCAENDDDDVWIPTDEEADGVAEPAGRLLARRLPEVPGGDASDAADLIALAIPLGIWAIRGLAAWLPRLRRGKTIRGQVLAAGPAEAP